MERGFIKLHRKIDSWEWYDHPNTFRLFIHCLIKANHKTKKWQGQLIKRGQFITSYQKLSSELNISVQQIRTALKNLIKTGEIIHKNNNKNGIITIVKYESYQYFNTPDNTQEKEENYDIIDKKESKIRQGNIPDNTQATHKQHTTNNNEEAIRSYKNEINKNSILSSKKTLDPANEIKIIIEYLNKKADTNYRDSGIKTKKLIQARMKEGFKTEDFKKVIDNKVSEWKGTEFEKFLRPETLFSNKFESYLNQKPFDGKKKTDEALEQYELVKLENTRNKANEKALKIYRELSQHFRQMSEYGIAFYSDGNVNVKSEFLRKYRKGV